MKNFEERLERLEEINQEINENEIPLDQAVKKFEEGIKLARTLEKDLASVERRIDILINNPSTDQSEPEQEKPKFDLFPDLDPSS